MKHITTLQYRGRTFEIVKNHGYYMAIEDKYIDEDGKLTIELNGIKMHANESIDQTIQSVKGMIDLSDQFIGPRKKEQ